MQEYNKADQQIHLISQIIAKVNRSLVPQKEDDSHTNLYFDALGKRIYGRWFSVNTAKYILFFDLVQQAISLQDQNYRVLETVNTDAKKIDEIENEVSRVLEKVGVKDKDIMAALHYDIEEYPMAKKALKNYSETALQQWVTYRKLANLGCYELLGHLQTDSEVRIWPHHFDTGIYTEPHKKLGIGFGLAMEDSMVGAPYFYLSGYGLKSEIEYKNLPSAIHWQWKTEEWKGVVLPLTELAKHTDHERKEILKEYISQNLHFYLQH